MGKKLKINEKQLEVIVNYINEAKNSEVLIENVKLNSNLIEEGFKDIVLGIAMLAGVGLTGQNQAIAQNALSNQQILNQVKSVLQDDRLEKVADSLEAAGMQDAMGKIQRNANRLEDAFNDKALKIKGVDGGIKIYTGKEVKKDTVSNYDELAKKLKFGYAIQGISQDTIRQIINKDFSEDPVVDSMTMVVDAGEFYGSGEYVLNEVGKVEVKDVLDQIKIQDGVVVGVRIESSTDKQRISTNLNTKLTELGYPSGNEGLSKVRNDQLKKQFINLGVSDSLVSQDFKWDEGKGELGAVDPQDPSARYVKIYIDVIHIEDSADAEVETVEDVIIYNFELVRVKKKSKVISITPSKKLTKAKTKRGTCNTGCATWK